MAASSAPDSHSKSGITLQKTVFAAPRAPATADANGKTGKPAALTAARLGEEEIEVSGGNELAQAAGDAAAAPDAGTIVLAQADTGAAAASAPAAAPCG